MSFRRIAPLLLLPALLSTTPLAAQRSSRITMSAPRPDPGPPRFTPATVAGCYDLSYSRWWFMGPVHAVDPAAVLPRRVQLDTMPMMYRSRFRVIKPAPSMTQIPPRDARAAWEMIGDDSLGIVWRESAGDVTLRVAIEADSLRGLAHSASNSPDPFQQPRAVVVGTRVPCASDQQPSREVVATKSDSLIARREAQGDADRIRRGFTIINAQHVHEMITRFRLVRGRVPEKLEELMTVEYTRYPKPDSMWLLDGWGRPFTYFVGPKVYELRSVGPDGRVGTDDDVVSKRSTP